MNEESAWRTGWITKGITYVITQLRADESWFLKTK